MAGTFLLDNPAEHVQTITLTRPERMNALNTEMGVELRTFFRELDLFQEPDLRALIITGEGDRAFCAGADLKERKGLSDSDWRKQHLIFEEMFEEARRCPVPMIAAVNGVALGGGNELAMMCDLVVASETAVFGMPEVKRGIMPGAGGTQRLPRRVGPSRAKDMIFTGRSVPAKEAYEWGLANRLVPPEYLMDEALALARLIAENGPIAVRQAKKSIDWGADLSLDAGLVLENEAYNVVIPSEDRREGIEAFNEKRPPRFRNR